MILLKEEFWGNYISDDYPKVNYDPLQSFHDDCELFGYRVHIVPSRGDRPRDFRRKIDESEIKKKPNDSVLLKVSHGKELSIPIASDKSIIGHYKDSPKYHNLSKSQAVAIINKFSPLNVNGGAASGLALVVYSNEFTTRLDNINSVKNILITIRTVISHFISRKPNPLIFNSALVFFNIGKSSGASLSHLHAQVYLIEKNAGILYYSHQKAQQQAYLHFNKCMICLMAENSLINDHIGQRVDVASRVVWSDENCVIIIPHAPIRALSLRIIPYDHHTSITSMRDEEIHSLAKALCIADLVIEQATPSRWPINIDRTITFRQIQQTKIDFHLFIDVIPTIPFGGSELVDSLSITPLDPLRTTKIMKNKLESILIQLKLNQ